MPLILDGTNGVSGVDGTAGTPSLQGTDSNTGVFYATDIVGISTGGSERMRIDSSGNVSIGTSSPSSRLHVKGTDVKLLLETSSGATSYIQQLSASPYNVSFYNQNAGSLIFGTNDTERMRIDSSGNVMIKNTTGASFTGNASADFSIGSGSTNAGMTIYSGTSSQGAISFADGTTGTQQYRGFIIYTHTTDFMNFGTSGVEAMRIDSSGNLLVGTTSENGQLTVYSSATSNNVAFLRATNASYAGEVCVIGADRNTTNGTFNAYSYYNYGAGAYRFKVLDSGNVQNTNNSYGALSDIKLKENITDATPKLDGLMQVRVVNYNFKNDQTHKQLGVIAQEIEQVFPAMVEETVDRDAEGNDLGTTTKSVKYSVFVPMLVKAIQEQQAIIEELKARIETLEAK